MRQFVLPGSWDGGPSCALSGREARRLSSVLRLDQGDRFPAVDANGLPFSCTILSTSRDTVILSVQPVGRPVDGYMPDIRASRGSAGTSVGSTQAGGFLPEPSTMPRFTLAVAILKGSKLDEVARAATEAGVSVIQPLVTARSVPAGHASGRLDRLRRIVAEARGQSGSAAPTRVADPVTIPELLSIFQPDNGRRLCLFFHEAPLAQASIHRYCTGIPDEIIACVGPEGGFDDRETSAFMTGGFKPAWLGPTVLRAETAAVFAVASLRIVCLERSSWSMTE